MNKQRTCLFLVLLVCLVLMPLKLMAIEMGTITLDVGESYSIDGEAGGAQAQSGYWSVDGDAIFSITAKSQTQCTIRAYKVGTSRLKYSYSYYDSNYNYKSGIAYWTIKVEAATVLVTNITLNKTSTTIGVGDTQQLTATVSPSDATNKNVSWTSSNTSIATVSSSGLVTAKSNGSATITCKANDGGGKQATCAVTVTEPIKVTGISLNYTKANLKKGETLQLAVTVSPADASNKNVTWASSDKTIATVNDDGVVTAVAYGSASVTCTAKDGSGVKCICDITVAKPDNWINSGNYTISWFNKNKDEFTISTAKELAGLAYIVNNGYTDFYGKTIKLAADIDLSGKDWTPCNIFRGTFDGDGHTISGIDINWEQSVTTYRDTIFVGLWRKIYNAEIRNVNLSGNYSVHCINDYSTDAYSCISIGGLAGEIWNTKMERCISNVNIELACNNNFEECWLGGLFGRVHYKSYSYSDGKSSICFCKYTGRLSCTGERAPWLSYFGGIVGYCNDSYTTIEFCENVTSLPFVYSTDIIGHIRIGGITGSGEGSILCCRNEMDSIVVKKCNALFVGGIDGDIWSDKEDRIKNCYSYIGEVHVKEGSNNDLYFGGILSRSSNLNTSGPIACFSNNDVKIITEKKVTRVHDGSTSFSSAQMQTAAFLEELNMYSTFNMDGPVWVQPAEGGYPYIAALGEATAVKPITLVESKNATVYTLSGQRITAPRKGINIVGGKKVIVK